MGEEMLTKGKVDRAGATLRAFAAARRVFSFGHAIAGPLTADELRELETKIAANTACGLANANATELVVEKLGPDGWRVDHVVDFATDSALFSNPIAMSGGDDG